jgi:four helix bundle protein
VANFRNLRVWEYAEKLAVEANRVADSMSGTLTVDLRKQLVRAANSVPANIVEGCEQSSPLEFARYLQYSLASTSEVEGHVQLARDLNKITYKDFNILLKLVETVRPMLVKLRQRVLARADRKPDKGKKESGR